MPQEMFAWDKEEQRVITSVDLGGKGWEIEER